MDVTKSKAASWAVRGVGFAAALTLAGCIGKTVPAGYVGIKVSNLGGAKGVDPTPLDVGWHSLGLGESIELYPSFTRTYSWTRPGAGDNRDANEEFVFNDSTALQITADVAITMHVDASKAPEVFQWRRLEFDQLLNGPVRASALQAISSESEKMRVDAFYTGGRQQVIAAALAEMRRQWAPHGVIIDDLQWLGSPRYPEVVTGALQAKAKADADTVAAQAQVAVAKAEADAKIETARGEAESNRLLAESIKANPQVVQLRAIEKWDGQLPTTTGGVIPFIDVKK